MSVRYEELAPREFRERLATAPIAYLPLGTLEWHGEHLPLGTDALESHAFFCRLAEEVGGIVLPSLHLGPDRTRNVNGEVLIGMDFWLEGEEKNLHAQRLDGSAYWVPDDLFAAMLDATLAQLKRAGFRIVVGHGHGPSTTYFAGHVDEWRERFGLVCMTARTPEDDPVEEHHTHGVMTDHAASNETALVMALRPELVHLDRLPEDPEERLIGVAGEDPRAGASPEYGERCLEIQTARMALILRRELERL
jgi:creatinine amidohydrolase